MYYVAQRQLLMEASYIELRIGETGNREFLRLCDCKYTETVPVFGISNILL